MLSYLIYILPHIQFGRCLREISNPSSGVISYLAFSFVLPPPRANSSFAWHRLLQFSYNVPGPVEAYD